jgi:radical SAM superfamily enzyme YgiQ (UPF0313 family)
MADIVLTTLNARYSHASLALRYLKANLAELSEQCDIVEFTTKAEVSHMVRDLLCRQPKTIGFGVYIWNVAATTELVKKIRQEAPHVMLVIGGPEVSFNMDGLEISNWVDHIVQGEGEHAFLEICRSHGGRSKKTEKEKQNPLAIVSAKVPSSHAGEPQIWPKNELPLAEIELPYRLYTDEDIRHRVIYVEASRGCPFRCQFCLSSLDKQVRQFSLERLFLELDALFTRGARTFKFIDRTFNLRLDVSERILEFFLERYVEGLFIHFEMVPDRFPDQLKQLVSRFPQGALQFEIGVQTFNEEVAARIERKNNLSSMQENFRFLREETGVHIHADLIVGLPGEDQESFGRGFDRLMSWQPQEIQVGILKKLRGTPISAHDQDFNMRYAEEAPYEILSTRHMSQAAMVGLKRFARYWDLYANSGRFQETRKFLWMGSDSPFTSFEQFCRYTYARFEKTHHLSLLELTENIFQYLIEEKQRPASEIQEALARDYTRDAARALPRFLRPADLAINERGASSSSSGQDRQARHNKRA